MPTSKPSHQTNQNGASSSSKSVSRRGFLASAPATAGVLALPKRTEAAAPPPVVPDFGHVQSKLYDATRCIGCRSCLRACREYNQLPPDVREHQGVQFDMPEQLAADNFMVIQAYRQEADEESGEPTSWSFIKKNCMHCNHPACVAACPVKAIVKTDEGPVRYAEKTCIGCRYCMLACPFSVPRYEWIERKPRVRKCNFNLACVKACPVEALTTGTRREMLQEAHRRIKEHPDRYVNHIYGEHEAGGTSYLILAGVPLDRLGLPALPQKAGVKYAETLMGALPGVIIGMGLFLGGLYQLEKRQQRDEADKTEPLATPEEELEG